MAWDVATPWSLKDALQVARALEDHGVYWMEEPLYRGDYEGMAQLRAATDLRIAGAEMTRELHELKTLIDRGCLDVLQPDAVLVGGITGLRRIAIMAQEAGLAFTPHTWGNGIGLMANIHLAAGIAGSPYLEFPYDPPEWTPERRDFMFSDPITVDSEGWITLSDRPGLGLTLDDDVLKRTRV
jgi:L-alanine-DL-glutamate epimerase-like enolase superfamily enzyme